MRTPRLRGLLSRDRTTGQIAVGLVGVLLVSALVYGVGLASAQYKISDVGAWLTASAKGMLVHANGLSGKVDGKTDLPFPRNHKIRIVQDGRNVLLIDDTTGVVSRIDPSQLKVEQGRKLGVGLEIVTGAGAAYTVDRYKGTVQQIDPMSLAAVGQPATLKAPLGRPALDQKGTLWVPSAGEGRLAAFQGGRQTRSVDVAGPTTVLSLSIVAGTPVAVDSAHAVAAVVRPEGAQKVKLPSTVTQTVPNGGVRLPALADSLTVPLLGRAGELTLLDTSTGGYTSVALKASRDALGEPQILGSKVYIPNETKGGLLVYNAATRSLEPFVPVSGRPGPLDVFLKDGLLWANDPDGDRALSVDSNGVRKPIRKYEDKVPGSNRKPLPDDKGDRNGSPGGNGGGNGGNTPARPPRQRPSDPPTAPQITATGKDGKITLQVAPSSYQQVKPEEYRFQSTPRAEGLPARAKPEDLPGNYVIENLPCGQEYRFTASVVYTDPRTRKKRARSSRASTTACEEPTKPVNVEATHAGNGVVRVTFQPGGDPTDVKSYVLTDHEGDPVGNVAPLPKDATHAFTVKGLTCGPEYRFKVVAKYGAKGDKEAPSDPTAEPGIRACTAPNGRVQGLKAEGFNHSAEVSWSPVAGQSIKYLVTWSGQFREVTGTQTTIEGLANNRQHSIAVRAINGAGQGPETTTQADLSYVRATYRNKANNQTNTIVRPGPSKSGSVGTIPRGEYRDITVICQVRGDTVTEDETKETSNIWNRIVWNGGEAYLSVTLMEGPREPGGKMFEC